MSFSLLRATRSCLFTTSLLVGVLTTATTVGQVLRTFDFQGLGSAPLAPGLRSFANAVSDDGRVVVGQGHTNQALRWTAETGWQALIPDAFTNSALDVSADGSIVVGLRVPTSSSDPDQLIRPFRWDTGTYEYLGGFPGGDIPSWATAVSRDGSIVVGGNSFEHGGPAFLWDGQMHALEPVDTGRNPMAVDVTVAPNGDIWTIGNSYGSSGAVFWRNHQFVNTLDGAGMGYGNAITSTEDGVVAVATLFLNATLFAPFLVRFNESTMQFEEEKMLALPVGETVQTYHATDISTNGRLVVGWHHSNSAVVWEESGQTWGTPVNVGSGEIGGRKIKDILLEGLSSERQAELNFANWDLQAANGVTMFREGSTVKSVVVGDGINPVGVIEGWRAEVTVQNPTVYVDVDPKSTYLRTADEPPPGETGEPLDARAIPLTTVLGVPIVAGDLLYLERVGNFKFVIGEPAGFEGPHGDWTLRNLWGVFSSSDELLTDDPMKSAPEDIVKRVSGALPRPLGTVPIDTVDDPINMSVFQPTNIEEDFIIDLEGPLENPPGIYVRVPEGATHLFVGAGDVQWFDNSLTQDIGRFGLNITLVTEPDFDLDGDVDGADFLEWQRGLGTIYDSTDLTDWQTNFGAPGLLTASGVSVPEPSSYVLLLTLVSLAYRRAWVQ